MADLEITNNFSNNRFETMIGGKLAHLDYRIQQKTIYLAYVAVPPEQQGQGIASKLTQIALQYARDNQLKVVPICPFIANYMRRHPEEG